MAATTQTTRAQRSRGLFALKTPVVEVPLDNGKPRRQTGRVVETHDGESAGTLARTRLTDRRSGGVPLRLMPARKVLGGLKASRAKKGESTQIASSVDAGDD